MLVLQLSVTAQTWILTVWTKVSSSSSSKGASGRCQTPSNVDPQSNGQQVRQQQRWKKNLQKVCWENASLLHNTCVSHAESSCALRVFKKELLGGNIFWPTWPIPYPIWVFLQDAFNFSSSLNVIFLRQSAVFLSKAVGVYFSSVGILWCLGARWAVTVRTLGATSSRFMLGIQQYFFHVTIINRDGGWNTAPIPIAEVQFYPGTLQVLLPALRHGGSAKEPEPNCGRAGLSGGHRELRGKDS